MACSIIVPVDLARRPLGLLRRLQGLLCEPAPQDTRELVLVHADRGSRWDRILERMSRRRSSGEVTIKRIAVHPSADDQGVPLARLRNAGIAAATEEDLLFVDADLLLPADLVVTARLLRDEQGWKHISVPVTYLGRRAPLARRTCQVRARRSLDTLADLFENPVAQFIQSVAVNSSLILVKADHVRRIGGFDAGYTGHGFEDFDLLMRLAYSAHPELLPAAALDYRSAPFPALESGFRTHLMQFSVPALRQGLMAYHLHHWRPRGDGYYEARQVNYERFCRRMVQLQIVDENAKAASEPRFDSASTAALLRRIVEASPLERLARLPLLRLPESRRLSRLERMTERVIKNVQLELESMAVRFSQARATNATDVKEAT